MAAGRRNPVSETPDLNSGNGGFTLVGESSQPILFDMNSTEGKLRVGLNTSNATTLQSEARIFGFRMKPGQDASCLNLFQATVPTLIGATPEFIARGGFRFADTPVETRGENAWTKLIKPLEDTSTDFTKAPLPTIPVIGDMNTLQVQPEEENRRHDSNARFPEPDVCIAGRGNARQQRLSGRARHV